MRADRLLGIGSRAAPSTIVGRLTARRAIRSGAVWGYVFGIYVASSAYAFADAYKTKAQRAALAKTFGSNAAIDALIGPARRIETVAGFTQWRSLGVLAVVGAAWGLLTATRLMRGEEEAGRSELLLAGATTPRRAAAGAMLGLGSGVLTLWLLTAAISTAVGHSSKVGISPAASLFLALALVSSAVVFLAVGALASQLAPTRRQASLYAASALGVSYALRMVADSDKGLVWLRWATPLGWVEQIRPLTMPDPAPLVPLAALVAVVSVLSVHLAGIRDLGASTIGDRDDPDPRTGLLGSAAGLAVRLLRPTVIAWEVAVGTWALLLGLITKTGGVALSGSSGVRKAFSRLGVPGSGARAYLGVAFLMLALLTAFVAAGQVGAARDEEAEGRLDHLLVRPLSRQKWLGARVGLAMFVVVLTALVASVFTWFGTAIEASGVSFSSLLEAGLNLAPPALMVLGLGVLTYACWPRAASIVVYGTITWSLAIELIGAIVTANHWLLDTSIFHQMAAAPAVSPDWTSAAAMAAAGIGATLAGGFAFAHRDLVGS